MFSFFDQHEYFEKKSYNILLVLVLVVFVILLLQKQFFKKLDGSNECESYMPCKVSKETILLSELLNESLMRIGKLQCQLSKKDVSENGGWCAKISNKKSIQHKTDRKLAKELSKFLRGKKVASFGDGPGAYKAYITKLGEIEKYDAFDGAPYAEETTDGDVKHLDLSVPVYHLPLYDWVISLEVAEHIPKEFENNYLDNLTRHAKEGIILSWAAQGQIGHSHVNNRNLDYVQNKLAVRGFKSDIKNSERMQNATELRWLKKNLHVYMRVL